MNNNSAYTKRLVPQTSTPFLLYILGLPLIPACVAALFNGNSIGGLAGIIGCILLFVSATLIKKGLRLERINAQRKWQRHTAMPWKFIGSILVGWSVIIVAKFMNTLPFGSALLIGALATIGTILRYGLDTRLQQTDTANRYGLSVDEIIALTDEARENIYSLEQSTNKIRSPDLSKKLRKIINRAKNIVDELEEDPTNLRQARKFLKVYLEGAMSVTGGYANQGQNAQNSDLDASFNRVLDTIDSTFNDQYQRLREHDVLNLDVQIEVLEQQLKLEGLS